MVDDLLLLARQNHPDRQPQVANNPRSRSRSSISMTSCSTTRSAASVTAIDTRVESPPGQVRCNSDHLAQVGRTLLDDALRPAMRIATLMVAGHDSPAGCRDPDDFEALDNLVDVIAI